jgi:hypothetical protein
VNQIWWIGWSLWKYLDHLFTYCNEIYAGVNPLQTTWMERGTVSSRVALLLRSAEVKPLFKRFVQLEKLNLYFIFIHAVTLGLALSPAVWRIVSTANTQRVNQTNSFKTAVGKVPGEKTCLMKESNDLVDEIRFSMCWEWCLWCCKVSLSSPIQDLSLQWQDEQTLLCMMWRNEHFLHILEWLSFVSDLKSYSWTKVMQLRTLIKVLNTMGLTLKQQLLISFLYLYYYIICKSPQLLFFFEVG